MDPENTLNTYFTNLLPRIEEEMHRVVNPPPGVSSSAGLDIRQPVIFNTMLNYHLGFADGDSSSARVYNGKRIRPVLTLLCCEACGGTTDAALPGAAAVELLHNFSLIHDDIEDCDELRRGRPTLWKVWGEAQAINSGDAMFTLAHIALESTVDRGVGAARVLHAMRVFDDACVALTIGQHLDLSFEDRTDVSSAEYMTMINGKTGALTQAACAIGAIIADAPAARVSALAEFGAWLGIAFQLQDDVLGIWGDPEKTGKQDSDLSHRKKTLPVLFAAEHDAAIRDLYFGQASHTGDESMNDDKIQLLRKGIEDCGGRAYTEQAALDAYNKSISALATARISGTAADALQELGRSLLGRTS
jgi:geranylgeranyl diphosphate synthase type I